MKESFESDQLEQSDFDLNPEPGKFYVVLGDSIEGYYFVRCLSCSEAIFQGKYLAICSQNVPSSNIILRETREKDMFNFGSLVSEINIVTEFLDKNVTKYFIEKEELSDILVTIGEMSDN